MNKKYKIGNNQLKDWKKINKKYKKINKRWIIIKKKIYRKLNKKLDVKNSNYNNLN